MTAALEVEPTADELWEQGIEALRRAERGYVEGADRRLHSRRPLAGADRKAAIDAAEAAFTAINPTITRLTFSEAYASRRLRRAGQMPAGHTCKGTVAGAATCVKCLSRKTPTIAPYRPPKLAAAHDCHGSPRREDTDRCRQCAARAKAWKAPALPTWKPIAHTRYKGQDY